MNATPDLAGFDEAQRRLRDLRGLDVTFYGPTATTWPPGVSLDPESGRPYDPTIKPLTTVAGSAVIRVSVARSTTTQASQSADSNAAGIAAPNHALLIATDTPQNRATIFAAVRCEISGKPYKVVDTSIDTPVRGHTRILTRARAEP